MKYYISDLHFGHSNIIKLCDRPFANLLEMDETLMRKYGFAVIFYRKPLDENGRATGEVFTEVTTGVTTEVTTGVTTEVTTKVSTIEELVLMALVADPMASYDTLPESLNLSRKTIGKYIKILKKKGILERIGGNTRNGYWQIIRR